MHSKSPLSQVDHGVDIIGDEWDDSEEQEDVEKTLNDIFPIPNKNIEYVKRHDPIHPYCTNWPVKKTKETNEKV